MRKRLAGSIEEHGATVRAGAKDINAKDINAKDINVKAIAHAEKNVQASLDHAQSMLRANDPAEMMRRREDLNPAVETGCRPVLVTYAASPGRMHCIAQY
jgi:hypothetical protein